MFDTFLCLLSKNTKSWCKRPVSVVHCRCAYESSPGRGVLPRQRPELSWHNFHYCIRKKMPGLELHVPTQTWKNPRQIPICVCLSHLFLLYLTMTIIDCIIFAHPCSKTLPGDVSMKENFSKMQKHFLLVSFLNATFSCFWSLTKLHQCTFTFKSVLL